MTGFYLPAVALLAVLLVGCAQRDHTPSAAVAAATVSEERDLDTLPLFKFTPQEIGTYLAQLHEREPDLRRRVAHLARKNIGQPYELYLLGEFPFETYDPLPLFSIGKGDCVVFSEHMYAMALSNSWEHFFWTLQRIRYRDGQIGLVTRNHFTEADWNLNNAWLLTDISAELAGDQAVSYAQRVDRARFLRNRYQLERDIPVETIKTSFVPLSILEDVLPQLDNGDFVNVVVGRNGGYWVTHVGLVVVAEDGTRHFLHSTPPAALDESFDAYITRSLARADRLTAEGGNPARLFGFKFLRLNETIDIPPAVSLPRPQ